MSYHNTFTHEVLRNTAMELKSKIFGYLDVKCLETLNSRLNELISNIFTRFNNSSELRFDSGDILVSHQTIGRAPCVIITMPPPKDITGAYFVAIVSRIPDTEVESRDRVESLRELPGSPVEECPINYYTLERGLAPRGEVATRFCEWSEKGHYNYCEGPTPTWECFLPFLEDVVVARAIEEGRTAVVTESQFQSPPKILDAQPMFRTFWSGEFLQ